MVVIYYLQAGNLLYTISDRYSIVIVNFNKKDKLIQFFFRCRSNNSNKTCIVPREYVCRNLVECDNIGLCDAGCSGYYRCSNGTCVAISTVCNGILNDGCKEDKEWISGPGFKCVREGKVCFIPQQLVMDGIQDCDGGQDFCFSLNEMQIDKRYHYFCWLSLRNSCTIVAVYLLSHLEVA